MTEIIYKTESYAIIGACFEVYKKATFPMCLSEPFASIRVIRGQLIL